MLEHQGVDSGSPDRKEVKERALSSRASRQNQRLFAAGFLRMMSSSPGFVADLDSDLRIKLSKLLERQSTLYKALRLDHKKQRFERLQLFEEVASGAEKRFREAFTLPTHLEAFSGVRQNIMRVYSNPFFCSVVVPFLPDFLSKQEIAAVLEAVYCYTQAPAHETATTYKIAKEMLETLSKQCREYDTYYVASVVLPFARQLNSALVTHFESSPANLPGDLRLVPYDKRYPFAVADAKIGLTFAVENRGPGMAFDVECEIAIEERIVLESRRQFLENIDQGERVEPVEFRGRVENAATDAVIVEYTVTWVNGDGQSRETEGIVELSCPAGQRAVGCVEVRRSVQLGTGSEDGGPPGTVGADESFGIEDSCTKCRIVLRFRTASSREDIACSGPARTPGTARGDNVVFGRRDGERVGRPRYD